MTPALHTKEVYVLLENANRLSREQFGNKGESHFHVGVNPEKDAETAADPLKKTFPYRHTWKNNNRNIYCAW
jgi:hypothetical protein